MLEGCEKPHNIVHCTECAEQFCAACEQPEPGRCKECRKVLCGFHYAEAVRNRRAVCFDCSNPRLNDEPYPTDLPPAEEEPYTHCSAGHALTPENSYEFPFGVIHCKICNRAKDRERLRAKAKKRTGEPVKPDPRTLWKHCVHGHPFDAANTGIRKDGNRFCKECGRIRAREYDRAKRAAAKGEK